MRSRWQSSPWPTGRGESYALRTPASFGLRELHGRVDALREVLAAARIPLDVLPGGEISPRDAAGMRPEELELIAQGPSGARWLLLEVPLWPGDRSFVPATDALRTEGYELVIGHPERGAGISMDMLHDQVDRGAILQINASSLAGRHGSESERRAFAITRSGLPFVIASDAHSAERPPLLGEAARRLAAAGDRAGRDRGGDRHRPGAAARARTPGGTE